MVSPASFPLISFLRTLAPFTVRDVRATVLTGVGPRGRGGGAYRDSSSTQLQLTLLAVRHLRARTNRRESKTHYTGNVETAKKAAYLPADLSPGASAQLADTSLHFHSDPAYTCASPGNRSLSLAKQHLCQMRKLSAGGKVAEQERTPISRSIEGPILPRNTGRQPARRRTTISGESR